MIRIAICDDDRRETELVKILLLNYMTQKNLSFDIEEFHSSDEVLANLNDAKPFHIYFLDILMPGHNGIDLGGKIRGASPSSMLIYLSSSPDYALEAFHVYAFQYILKPAAKHTLYPVMDKALSLLSAKSDPCFLLKTKTGVMTLESSSIDHIEYLNHFIYVYMTDGKKHTSTTMRIKFDEIVKDLAVLPCFLKPHKSFLVNINHVAALQETSFLMQSGAIIPISKNSYGSIKKKYIDFILEKGYGGIHDL